MSEFFCPDKTTLSQNCEETARYLGYRKFDIPGADVEALIKKAAAEMHPLLNPQAVFEVFDLKIEGDRKITIADFSFESEDLGRNLRGCSRVAMMAATIGPQVDALIRKTQIKDSVYAAILQATGAMYIEELVEAVNKKVKDDAEATGTTTKPRYSPGYGDASLNLQKEFFRLLPCARIGLTLMNTLIMAPEKSVTAFIGIK